MFYRLKLFINNVGNFKFKYWWLVIIAMLLHRLPFLLFIPSEAVIVKQVAMIAAYIILTFALLKNLKNFGKHKSLRSARLLTLTQN